MPMGIIVVEYGNTLNPNKMSKKVILFANLPTHTSALLVCLDSELIMHSSIQLLPSVHLLSSSQLFFLRTRMKVEKVGEGNVTRGGSRAETTTCWVFLFSFRKRYCVIMLFKGYYIVCMNQWFAQGLYGFLRFASVHTTAIMTQDLSLIKAKQSCKGQCVCHSGPVMSQPESTSSIVQWTHTCGW